MLWLYFIIYFLSYFFFWWFLGTRKRSTKVVRWASLIALGPVIICSVFIQDKLAEYLKLESGVMFFKIAILILLIYCFRLFEEIVINKSVKEHSAASVHEIL
jgi:formate-dependent nitrite reductase membrane component NrfD